jgi:hypothetical protein
MSNQVNGVNGARAQASTPGDRSLVLHILDVDPNPVFQWATFKVNVAIGEEVEGQRRPLDNGCTVKIWIKHDSNIIHEEDFKVENHVEHRFESYATRLSAGSKEITAVADIVAVDGGQPVRVKSRTQLSPCRIGTYSVP